MKIEICDFYEIKRNEKADLLIGTMHAYLIDFEIDIRGIYVSKSKKNWYFGMPSKKAVDGKELVTYPLITFSNSEKQKEFMLNIRKLGKEYILKKCFDNNMRLKPSE